MEGKLYYVTKEKLEKLKKEHAELVAFEHKKLAMEEAPKVLESEDMNPEFVAFQEDMDKLRLRIDELSAVFSNHEIIKTPPKEQQSQVALGAKVKIGMGNKENEFMLVGTLEADPMAGKISNESPVGKAILGKKIGDEVIVPTPEKLKYTIKHISYDIS